MIIPFILLIKIFLMTWFITNNDYIQENLTKLVDKYNNVFTVMLFEIVSCHKCLSFWVVLGFTFNIYIALAVSFIAYLTEKK